MIVRVVPTFAAFGIVLGGIVTRGAIAAFVCALFVAVLGAQTVSPEAQKHIATPLMREGS